MIAVSVVVPIYKAEATLLRCLDSLKAQTFTDFEVLMIDDGSPDKCGGMIDEYAEKDSRFKAIHQPNRGVSAARQCGIDHAQGEYTIHTDPDDWVEPTMLEELYAKAKEEDADMVICDFYENRLNTQTYIKQTPSLVNEELLVQLFSIVMGSTCNKLIRHSCYRKYKVHFPTEFNYCEDLYVVTSFVKQNISVSYLNKAFYHYVKDNNPMSQSRYYDENSYQTDLIMARTFNSLLKGTVAEKTCNEAFKLSTVSRAFYFGYHTFSNQLFRTFFYDYIPTIQISKKTRLDKLLLVLSCKGYYHSAYHFLKLLIRFKNILIK